jgi:hypothetical protein
MGRRRTPYRVIQRHHLSYAPEVVKYVFRSEHRILTWLDRVEKSKPSQTFLDELQNFVLKKRGGCSYTDDEMRRLYEVNQLKRVQRRRRVKPFPTS